MPCDALRVAARETSNMLTFKLDGTVYRVVMTSGVTHVASVQFLWTPPSLSPPLVGQPAECLNHIRHQLALQLEPLLLLSHKLQLPNLQVKLHRFIQANSMLEASLFNTEVLKARIFTDRVVGAMALGLSSLDAAVGSVVGACTLLGAHEPLLSMVHGVSLNGSVLRFRANTTRAFLGEPVDSLFEFQLDISSNQLQVAKPRTNFDPILGVFGVQVSLVPRQS